MTGHERDGKAILLEPRSVQKAISYQMKFHAGIITIVIGAMTLMVGCQKKNDQVQIERDQAIGLITQLGGKYEVDQNAPGNPKPLTTISLAGRNINDEGMLKLKGMTSITNLDLNGCLEVGDAGLGATRDMKALYSLMLWGCHGITDLGFQHLRAFTNLTYLNIGYTGVETITGSGLVHLRGLTNLQYLGLNVLRKLEERHLENLTALVNLQRLHLGACVQITDEGLDYIAQLPLLKELELHETQITAAGLQKLKVLKNLKSLTLSKALPLDVRVDDLLRALPGLNITWIE